MYDDFMTRIKMLIRETRNEAEMSSPRRAQVTKAVADRFQMEVDMYEDHVAGHPPHKAVGSREPRFTPHHCHYCK